MSNKDVPQVTTRNRMGGPNAGGLRITRRAGEGFWIGPNIYVRVLDDGGRQIALSINAPSDAVILREELCASEDAKGPGAWSRS